jgi:hypothetical protein
MVKTQDLGGNGPALGGRNLAPKQPESTTRRVVKKIGQLIGLGHLLQPRANHKAIQNMAL